MAATDVVLKLDRLGLAAVVATRATDGLCERASRDLGQLAVVPTHLEVGAYFRVTREELVALDEVLGSLEGEHWLRQLVTPLLRGCVRYVCPCCEYPTLDARPPGSHHVCPICWWEDCWVQFHDREPRELEAYPCFEVTELGGNHRVVIAVVRGEARYWWTTDHDPFARHPVDEHGILHSAEDAIVLCEQLVCDHAEITVSRQVLCRSRSN